MAPNPLTSGSALLPSLEMHAAPSFKGYKKIAKVANVPVSLSEAAYEHAIAQHDKDFHRFAWAHAVAEEIYMLCQPDYIEHGHVEVMAQALVTAHKKVVGYNHHHLEFERVLGVLANLRSEEQQKSYDNHRQSYYGQLMAWTNEQPSIEDTVDLTESQPATKQIAKNREAVITDLTASPTPESTSTHGQDLGLMVCQIRPKRKAATEFFEQPNKRSKANAQSIANERTITNKHSITNKQTVANKQPMMNGPSPPVNPVGHGLMSPPEVRYSFCSSSCFQKFSCCHPEIGNFLSWIWH